MPLTLLIGRLRQLPPQSLKQLSGNNMQRGSYRFDNVEFDPARMALLVDQREVDVQPHSLSVLLRLLERSPQVVTTDELLDTVWTRDVAPAAVAMAITRLRKAIADSSRERIVTVRKSGHSPSGYRFAGPVERVFSGDTDRLEDSSALEAARIRATGDFLRDVLQPPDLARGGSAKPPTMLDMLRRATAVAADRFHGQPRTEAAVRRRIGEALLRVLEPRLAELEFRRALLLLDPLVPSNDSELLGVRFGLAQALANSYKVDEAAAVLEQAERDAEPELLSSDNELAVLALQAKLDVLLARMQHELALDVAKRLVSQVEGWPGASLATRFDARQRLAEVLFRLNEIGKAHATLAPLMEPPFNAADAGEITFARARLSLGTALKRQGRIDEARPLLEEVRDSLTAALGAKALHVGYANYELADIYDDAGDLLLAKDAIEAAHAAFTASLDHDHGHIKATAANAAVIALELGDAAGSLRALDQLRPWFEAYAGAADSIDFYRAWALCDLGRASEALGLLDGLRLDQLAWGSWGPNDWAARVQAERGRALMGLGRQQEGLRLIHAALVDILLAGSLPKTASRYRQLLIDPLDESSTHPP